MGRVYLAKDVKHGRQVAIKVLDPEYARAVGTQRFVREIHIAATLIHPNIVPLYDSGEVNGLLFYVMPYLEGESLRQLLTRETMLPVEKVVDWAAEICAGLQFAHSHGIVHRDVKPENLLIQSGRLLIADFGIARAIDLAAGDAITSEQLVLGTPIYMSPEQASGSKLDARTDIYSLACVVYEMLVGEPPFHGPTPQAITAKKLSGRYPQLRVIRATLPEALDEVLSRALAVIPADRFASAEEFASCLRTAVKPRRKHRISRLGVFLGLLLVGLGVFIARSRHSSVPPSKPRIVVGAFANRTGDSRHDPLGFMAADWITEGLQRTGAVDVVPSLTALTALHSLEGRADTLKDPVRTLARETGATLVITGAIYRDQDSLVFQSQVISQQGDHLMGAVEPIRVAESRSSDGLQQLRSRLMGLLALSQDDRVLRVERPPTFVAYQAFSEGMDAYVKTDYRPALAAFKKAYASDTSFILPLLYAAFCHVDLRERAQADSVLRIVSERRARLNQYDRNWLDYQRAEIVGNDTQALDAIRQAAELAPLSKATYNFAVTAYEARQPFQAESALRTLPPDIGPMRGLLPYWELLTMAYHVQGKHRQELKTAREARRRFQGKFATYIYEARALAAQDKSNELEGLWTDAATKQGAENAQLGSLGYEIGSELWAHADTSAARSWFTRALQVFRSAGPQLATTESRWEEAQTAARLGQVKDATRITQELITEDTAQSAYYSGFLGTLAVRSGSRAAAESLMEQLAADSRPYGLGVPQFQAGRIAAVLGDSSRANELFVFALDRGYPYVFEFHRDPVTLSIRNLPVVHQLDIRRKQ
jgi:serine/threonine-protein kinase